MDHAEAHERIADLAIDRDALERLAVTGTDDRPFLEHVRGCVTCRADLAAVRVLDRGLRAALGVLADAAAIEPIHPPDSLRDAVMEAARREPRLTPAGESVRTSGTVGATASGASDSPRRSPRLWRIDLPRLSPMQWATGLAAALVIAIVGGFAGRALAPGGAAPDASLVAAVATFDRVLAAPDHRVATLSTPGGAASGSVAWSLQDFVVLTSALSTPQSGRIYRCWLEWSGRWAVVGSMDFAGATAYWTGPVGEWTKILVDPGTRFVVTAEAAGTPGESPSGEVLLQASLGS